MARNDREDLNFADLANIEPPIDPHEMGTIPPIEPNHQRHTGPLGDAYASPNSLRRKIDRLFAQDRLPLECRSLDEIGMGIRRRCDDDGIYVRGADEVTGGFEPGAKRNKTR